MCLIKDLESVGSKLNKVCAKEHCNDDLKSK